MISTNIYIYIYICLWNHHYRQDNEHFYHPQVFLYLFVILLSRAWATTDLLSITLDSFAFSRLLYKYKSYSTVCSFYLVPFTQYNCSEIYLLHILRAIPFHYWVLFHYIDILHFICTFLLFPVFSYYKYSSYYKHYVQVIVWRYTFIFIPGSRMIFHLYEIPRTLSREQYEAIIALISLVYHLWYIIHFSCLMSNVLDIGNSYNNFFYFLLF